MRGGAQVTITGWPNPSDLIYTNRQCASVIVGYDLQILTGAWLGSVQHGIQSGAHSIRDRGRRASWHAGMSGDATNPQNKILYANLCLRSATWTFPAGQDADVPYP